MANLKSLIRVRRHTIDQKQKALSDLYRKAEQLSDEKVMLLDRLEEERANLIEMDVKMLSYFGPYSDAVKERVLAIDAAMKTLEARIEIARDDIRRAFTELKKVEITQERREEREEAVRNKRESQDLDAVAIEGFRRKQESE